MIGTHETLPPFFRKPCAFLCMTDTERGAHWLMCGCVNAFLLQRVHSGQRISSLSRYPLSQTVPHTSSCFCRHRIDILKNPSLQTTQLRGNSTSQSARGFGFCARLRALERCSPTGTKKKSREKGCVRSHTDRFLGTPATSQPSVCLAMRAHVCSHACVCVCGSFVRNMALERREARRLSPD